MGKSGNSWFKSKRAKLKKQNAALPRALTAPTDKTIPPCDGVKVVPCGTGDYVPTRCNLNGRMQADTRTYGNFKRRAQGISWVSYGQNESRLIPAR